MTSTFGHFQKTTCGLLENSITQEVEKRKG